MTTNQIISDGLPIPPADEPATGRRVRRRSGSPWRRPMAVIGVVVIAFWLLVALLAPWLAPYDPLVQDFPRLAAPDSAHLLGTDGSGRDVLRRLMYGARVSIPLAVLLVALSTLVGSTLGAIAGYFGRWADGIVMRIADLVFAFPGIILAMAAAAAVHGHFVDVRQLV